VVLARFDGNAVGIFESTRVAVGPRCDYGIAVYGTEGSVAWDFERAGELNISLCGAENYGFVRNLTGPGDGDFGRFQPGAGLLLSFDALKTVEAKLFLESYVTGRQLAPSVADGLAAARIVAAAEQSASGGRWHSVAKVTGRSTFAV